MAHKRVNQPRSIRTNIDTTRQREAVRGPGVDTRTWIAWGEIQELGHDESGGIFADVRVMPDGKLETCFIGSDHVDDQGGDWTGGYKVGDNVVILFPGGDESLGPTIVCQVWNKSNRPAPDFGDGTEPTTDRVIRMGKGKKFRVRSSGTGGDIDMQAESGGNISAQSVGNGTSTLASEVQVIVDAPKVILGKGGSAVAVVGGPVSVTVPPLVCMVAGVPQPVFPAVMTSPPTSPLEIQAAGSIAFGITTVEAGEH